MTPTAETEDQRMLAQIAKNTLGQSDAFVTISTSDLEAVGLGVKTLAYADWLKRHGLRMGWPVRRGVVKLWRQQ